MTTEQIFRGAEVASTFGRMLGKVPKIVGSNISLQGASHLKAASILSTAAANCGVTKEELFSDLRTFLELDADDQNTDQRIVVEWLESTRLEIEERSGDYSDRLLFVFGQGGTGKTETIAQLAKVATANEMITYICAPTNRAVRTLAKRCAAATGSSDYINYATCHSAFRTLRLNPIGLAVVRSLRSVGVPSIDLPSADQELVERANSMLDAFRISSAVDHKKSVLADAALLGDLSELTQEGEKMALSILRRVGFDQLDNTVCRWGDGAMITPDLVIIDEISMVGACFVKDALDTGAIVICAGDVAQLEPVSLQSTNAEGRTFNDVPAATLAKSGNRTFLVHNRRTSDKTRISEIANMALSAKFDALRQEIRQAAKQDGSGVHVFSSLFNVPKQDLIDGPLIAYRNIARVAANRRIRNILELPADRLVEGDKLIVTTRSDYAPKDAFLTYQRAADGSLMQQQILLDEAGGQVVVSDLSLTDTHCADEEYRQYLSAIAKGTDIAFDPDGWGAQPGALPVALAWAMTVHKAQGGEWPVVTLDLGDIAKCAALFQRFDETPGLGGLAWESWRRIVYTAISRARERINILL